MARRLAACVAALLACAPVAAQQTAETAGEVTLRGPSGFSQTGRFISYDGRYFRIESPGGELTLDGDVVICEGEACPPEEDWVPLLRLSGERAMGEVLIPALIEAFAARRGLGAVRIETGDPDRLFYALRIAGEDVARFEIALSSSAEGLADLLAKETDLAMSARPATPAEVRMGVAADLGDLAAPERVRIVALDAMVPVVARDNPVRRLTFAEVEAALSGGIVDWFDLGGDPGPVSVRVPDPATALGARVETLTATGAAAASGDGAAVAAAVAADRRAIGIARLSALRGSGVVVPSTGGGCGIDLPVTSEAVRRGDHPYAYPLLLIEAERRRSDLTRAFLDFVLSDDAQPVVRRAGFVDRLSRAVPLSDMGMRLVAAVRAAEGEAGLEALQVVLGRLDGAERLSVTFRDAPDASALSREGVRRLARDIEAGLHDGREIVFAGFAPQGAAAARRDAEAYRRAVLERIDAAAARRVRLTVLGAGDVMPILCEDAPQARQLSRRVEIWRRG